MAETLNAGMESDDVADRLAADIQAGRYSPGTWLKQVDLQTRYDANRSEVRKALASLASKRLIKYEPNRGYYVHLNDEVLFDEIRDLRIMLETSATEFMIANVRDDQIRELRKLAEAFQALLPSGTIMAIYEANLAFHAALLATTGNRSLVEIVHDLRLRTPPAPATQWSTRARVEQSGREHLEMVEALAARDPKRLARVIRQHIEQSEPGAGETHTTG